MVVIFLNYQKKKQYDFVIELILPWFIQFYISWYEADKKNLIDFHWLTYEDLMKDKVKEISKIMRFYNLNVNENIIKSSLEIDKKKARLNKGVSGRGMKLLTKGQIKKIKSYFKYYPDIDFTRIGIKNLQKEIK